MTAGSPTRPSLLIQIRDPADQTAWATFVGLYTPLIHGYCRQRGLQDADAADVAQEVMRSVAGAIRRFEYDPQRGSFRGWLLTITRNKLRNFLGAQVRQPATVSDTTLLCQVEASPTPDEEAGWEQDYRRRLFGWAAATVQQEVKPGTWRAFCLTAIEDLTAAEAAAATGLSPGGVYVARCRVTARLRELIASVADDPVGLVPPLERCRGA